MTVRILVGDALETLRGLPSASVQCCVTSPPYFGLRDYGVSGQIGLEPTPEAFVEQLVGVFAEVRRVLRADGTLWLNIGDSYSHGGCGSRDPSRWPKQSRNDHMRRHAKKGAGAKPKDLIGIPWMLAFALRAEGWYLRQDIIWHKPNPMPESVQDRCTRAHEYLFLLSKSGRYFFDSEAMREPGSIAAGTRAAKGSNVRSELKDVNGRPPEYWEYDGFRNRRSVWSVNTKPFPGAHFATFPVELISPCIAAGSRAGDTVLDPFGGAGTTALAADRLGRDAILIELNPAFAAMAERRLHADGGLFAETETFAPPAPSNTEAAAA